MLFYSCNGYTARPLDYLNGVATDPMFSVYNTVGRSQITYTNGDELNPEYLIITCNEVTKEMEIQYYISHEGFQVVDADYFTIQRYPQGYLKMTPPYYAPSVVIFDAGMAGKGDHLITAIKRLIDGGKWGVVFTFETFVNNHDIITRAWSEIIPSYVFRRDLSKADLSICEDTRFNSILPLLRHSDEN